MAYIRTHYIKYLDKMDMKDFVKIQMMTQMGTLNKGKDGTDMSFASIIWQLVFVLFMSLLDDITKAIPKILSDCKETCKSVFFRKLNDNLIHLDNVQLNQLQDTAIAMSTRHNINSFTMSRTYASDDKKNQIYNEESNAMIDSVLNFISKLDNIPSFNLIEKGNIIMTYKEKPIQITRDIYFKIDNVELSPEGRVNSIKISLLSNTISAADITKFVSNIYSNYLQEMKNSLGGKILYFDQKSREGKPPSPPPQKAASPEAHALAIINHRTMLIASSPKVLSFVMSPFQSNKRFANIYGSDIRQIEKRVKFFIENKDWYDAKGIPYQLGLLLSGVPGCGKTSIIKAISNMTKRHIINVNFANITTATQLKNLFYSDKLNVYTDSNMSNTQSYFIPIEQRLYVLEEIDAIGDIVKQRDYSINNIEAAPSCINDELTLMEILTVLDGTLEAPGRIIVMTTNHPEVLDAALIRPGRIDVQVHFNYASINQIVEMYEGYLDRPLSKHLWDKLPNLILSPAEIGQVLFKYFDKLGDEFLDEEAIVNDIIERAYSKKSTNNNSDVSSMKSDDTAHSENAEIKPYLSSNLHKEPGTCEQNNDIIDPTSLKNVNLPAKPNEGQIEKLQDIAFCGGFQNYCKSFVTDQILNQTNNAQKEFVVLAINNKKLHTKNSKIELERLNGLGSEWAGQEGSDDTERVTPYNDKIQKDHQDETEFLPSLFDKISFDKVAISEMKPYDQLYDQLYDQIFETKSQDLLTKPWISVDQVHSDPSSNNT